MASSPRYIWLDNSLKNFAEGTVPFINAGLHYGISVFEGIRCYATPRGPAIFRLEEHVDRLIDSAHIIGFRDLSFTRDQIIDAIYQTVAANGFPACYVRPLIFLDGGMNMVIDTGKPRLVVAVWEWTTFFTADAKERGVRANVSSLTRLHPNVSMTKAKISGNYVGSVMAKTESVRLGFDEAIMLDPSGYVAECTGENLFVARKGVIYTVPRSSILEGITRDSLLTLAREIGYNVVEEPISRDQLYISDEVFVCGTAAEVIAIREIDYRTIGNGKAGPVARALQQVFDRVTTGPHPRSEQWLSYVPAFAASVKA
jgi:branched-chain amino acid aminotransferase